MEVNDVGRDEKLQQVERILQSRAMQGSENLKSFLRFVTTKSIDQSTDQLKEYTIATEVFGRSNDFSPRIDSVVRVQASRLRHKLHEYYENEGRTDKIVVELPKGHYCPVFTVNAEATESLPKLLPETNGAKVDIQVEPQPQIESTPGPSQSKRMIAALSVAVLVLAGAVLTLAVWNSNLRRRTNIAGTENRSLKFGPVWETFLENDDQTIVVLSNPVVYRFTNPQDTRTLLKNSVALSPDQVKYINQTVGEKFMVKHSAGRVVLSADSYTGMGEAIGLSRVTNLFRSADRKALLKQSRTISPEDLKNHNVIFLGSMWVNDWSGKLPINEDFTYSSDATIQNINPHPGEEREYSPTFDVEGRLTEDYGLITVKPNILYKNTLMVIAGIHSEGTEAASEYVTNPDYLGVLTDHLHQLSDSSGPPKYYQALLRVAVDHGMPTTISLVAVHALTAQNN